MGLDLSDLANQYSALAEDDTKAPKDREAALLFSVAEKHLEEEEDEDSALTAIDEALQIFREIDDSCGIADSVRLKIKALMLKDKRKEAQELGKEELSHFRDLGDKRGEGAVLLALAESSFDTVGSRRKDDSLMYAKQAKNAFRSLGDAKLEATTFLALAQIYIARATMVIDRRAEYAIAMDWAMEARKAFRKLDDKAMEAKALHAISVAHAGRKEYADALRNADKALSLFTDCDMKKFEGITLRIIAMWNILKKDWQEAVTPARQAIDTFRELGYGKGWEAAALDVLVQAYLGMEDVEKAEKSIDEALKKAKSANDTKCEGSVHEVAYMMRTELFQYDEALAAAEKAVEVHSNRGAVKDEAIMQYQIAYLQLEKKKLDEAQTAAKAALKLLLEVEDDKRVQAEEVAVSYALAEAYAAKKDDRQALDTLAEAKERAKIASDRKEEANALLLTCNVHLEKERYQDAEETAREALIICKEIQDERMEALAKAVVAESLMLKEDWHPAMQLAEEARGHMRFAGDGAGEVHMLLLISQIAVTHAEKTGPHNRMWPRSLQVVDEAVGLAQRQGEKRIVINALCVATYVFCAANKAEEGKKRIDEAKILSEDLGDKRLLAVVLLYAAQVYFMLKEDEAGDDACAKAIELFKKIGDEDGEARANEIAYREPEGIFVPVGEFMDGQPVPESMPGEAAAAPAPSAQVAAPAAPKGPDPRMLQAKLQAISRDLFTVDEVEADTPLLEAGLDSLSMLEFHGMVTRELPGITLSPTLLFDYPTIRELTDTLVETVTEQQAARG